MAQNNQFRAGPQQPAPMPPQHTHQQSPPTYPVPRQNAPPPLATGQLAGLPANLLDLVKNLPPEQLLAIVQAVQNGQLALPQAQAQPAALPIAAAVPAPPPYPGAHAASVVMNGAVHQHDVDMDREDGELEEGEEPRAGNARDFLRLPPTGPRKRSLSPRARQGPVLTGRRTSVHTSPKVGRAPNGQQTGRPEAPSAPNASGAGFGGIKLDAGAAARKFVLQMYEAGYTFEQLAKEIPNRNALARMWKTLSLPMPADSASAKMHGMAAVLSQAQALPGASVKQAPQARLATQVDVAAPDVAGTQAASQVKPAARAPAKPTSSREEYLAKLQAAKNAKGKAPATLSRVPKAAERIAAVVPTIAAHAPVPSNPHQHAITPAAPQSTAQPTPSKLDMKNELLRQKLEALKAAQAASKAAQTAQAAQAAKVARGPSIDLTGSSSPNIMERANGPRPAQHPAAVSAIPIANRNVAASSAIFGARPNVPFSQPSAMQHPPPIQQPIQPPPPPMRTSFFSPPPPTPGRPYSALPGLSLPGLSLPGLFMPGTPVQPSPSLQQSSTSSSALPTANAVPKPAGPSVLAVSAFAPQVAPTAAATSYPRPILPAASAPQAVFPGGNTAIASSPIASPGPLNAARKRPVAADFDAEIVPRPAPGAVHRPFSFGQSRSASESERIVIEVSDDEDEDEDEDEDSMDLDPTPSQAAPGTIAQQPFKRPAPILPGLPGYQAPAAVPAVLTPGNAAAIEREVAEMKRKIAEKEAKRRIREANGTASGQITPAALVIETRAADSPAHKSLPGSVNGPGRSGSVASEGPLSAAAMARNEERARLEARRNELHRQLAGESGVVGSTSSAQTTTPAIPSLMPTAESVQQQQLVNNAEVSEVVETAAPAEPVPMQESNGKETDEFQKTKICKFWQAGRCTKGEACTYLHDGPSTSGQDPTDEDTAVESQATTVAERQMGGEGDDATLVPETVSRDAATAPDSTEGSFSPDASVPEVIMSNYEAAVASHDDVAMDVDSADEEEDDHISEDGFDARARHEPSLPTARVSSNGDLLSDAHDSAQYPSASASTTGTEDQGNPSVVRRALRSDAGHLANQTQEDEDDYEPSLAVESPAAQYAQDDEHEDDDDDEEVLMISEVKDTKTAHGQAIADDLAPELQPAIEEQTLVHDQDTKPPTNFFRPYQSPLTQFKDYRYHPDFLASVPGGYKSVSYSHKIDTSKHLCRHDAGGEQCNDRSCQDQHFRDMDLNDNELLKALGTSNTPTPTPEARKRWNEGLATVVKQLRGTKEGKDANFIAARIAQYRREFMEEPWMVLNLG
ncbi:Zinc finger C3H1 domain-containing protein [Teratosphaeriaceae sp. CCFEE 6253]|nr:Zinc finger C3H1 domain-containing protein [Teratosphaeriaceae sp. CCFEE 6253]